MKTIQKLTLLLALLVMCTGVFAQDAKSTKDKKDKKEMTDSKGKKEKKEKKEGWKKEGRGEQDEETQQQVPAPGTRSR